MIIPMGEIKWSLFLGSEFFSLNKELERVKKLLNGHHKLPLLSDCWHKVRWGDASDSESALESVRG